MNSITSADSIRRAAALRLVLLVAALLIANCLACRATDDAPNAGVASSVTSGADVGRERVTGTRGGRVVYRLTSPPKTFNYLLAEDEATLVTSFYLIGGRLVEFDHDRGHYISALAEGWRMNEDGRTLDLTLREDARFSDGRSVMADDVRFTLQAIYDQRTASPAFASALTIGGKQIVASVADDRRVRLAFPETVAAPESYLANIAVLPRHKLAGAFSSGGMRDAYAVTTAPQEVVTAGAFVVRESVPGERVVFAPNPHYWKRDAAGGRLPYLDELVLEVVAEANAAGARLTSGSLDIIDRLRPSDYAALRSSAATARAYDLGAGLNTDHLWFNLNNPARGEARSRREAKLKWFSDVRFRRAVSHAVDRRGIATSVLQGLATPLAGIVSPGNRVWAAEGLMPLDYDLNAARSLLSEAGYIRREANDRAELYDANGERVAWTIIVPVENTQRVQMATAIQEDLAQLGIDIVVAPVEFAELTRRWSKSYDYDAILLGASITEPDPSSYVNLLRSSSPGHQWHPSQSAPATEWERRIDELLDGQAHETDPARRRALFREVQIVLAEQTPIIPIVTRHILVGVNTRVGNFRPARTLPFSLWNAEELFVRSG